MQAIENEHQNISLVSIFDMESHGSVTYATEDAAELDTIQCNCHELTAKPLFEMPIQLEQCSICYENISMVNITVTRCGHTFHSSCIFNSLDYGEHCPMCRTQLIPLRDENEEEGDEEEDDEGDEEDEEDYDDLLYRPIGRNVDDIYHTPVCIESLQSMLDIFNREITGGMFNNDNGKLWMVLVTNILDDKFDAGEYDEFGIDTYDGIVNYGCMITSLMEIFKRTRILNKHIQCKADKMKKSIEIANTLSQHLINKMLKLSPGWTI